MHKKKETHPWKVPNPFNPPPSKATIPWQDKMGVK